MADQSHPEHVALGGDFMDLRYSSKTGEERDAHRNEVERQRAERKAAVKKRTQMRQEEEQAAARRKRIKRTAWEQHGRVLTDAEADKVAAEGLDDGPPNRDDGGGTVEQEAMRAADKANANRHTPPHLKS